MHGRRWFFQNIRNRQDDSEHEQCNERGSSGRENGRGTEETENNSEENIQVDWDEIIDNMLKLALRIGVSKEEFENITPHEFELMIEAYKEQQKHANYMMWVNGIYTMSALQASVGNMFKKKGTDPIKYFEEPLPIFEERKELTEEEKISEEKKLLLMLESMQFAFESNHK